MLKPYIGVKIINAEPQLKDGQDGYKVIYEDGYVSWSPAETFEASYREIREKEVDLLGETVN